ncbi:MAG: peptidylprolyl isomerase [Patescibacteria group bacterium]
MKKIFFILVILALALGVSACTRENQTSGGNISISSQMADEGANVAPSPIPEKDNKSADGEKTAAPVAPAPVETNKIMLMPNEQPKLYPEYSQALIKTNYGDIQVKLYGDDSPLTVNNFLYLAKEGFYNGIKFHRVIPDFMIQAGDPLSKGADTSVWGTGGPGYQFQDEFNGRKIVAGSLAMANAGPGTNGSQFFIVTAEATPWLDGKHTNFGEVVSGMDVVKKIEAVETVGKNIYDRPVKDVVINSIELLK